MKSKELYYRYKHIIWPLFAGLASIVILSLVIIPQMLGYLDTRGKIITLSQRSSTLLAKASELQTVDKGVTQSDLKTVFTVLPTDQDAPQAMTILQGQIAKSGLVLKHTNFVPSGQQNKDSYQFNVVVNGPIAALRNLLINLEDSPRIFQVESMNIKFQKQDQTLEAEIPVSVFYKGAPSTIGAIDKPVQKITDEERKTLVKLTSLVAQTVGSWQVNQATATPTFPSAPGPVGKADPFE